MICSHHEPFAVNRLSAPPNERLGGERQHDVRHPADVGTEESRRHHADDGERNALHRELAPDDVVGAGETLLPETMADDGDRPICLSAAVISRREHPSADTGDAEHLEEPAADVRAVYRFGLTAGRQVEPLRRPGERAVEQLGLPHLDLVPDWIRP